MNKACLLLAITCVAITPHAPLYAGDTANAPMDKGDSPVVQQVDMAWRDMKLMADKGAASHSEVLAARVKLAEARIREEQQVIVSARKEQVTDAEKLQKSGAATEADVTKANAALQEALLAMVKD